jgi:hypothetical protein
MLHVQRCWWQMAKDVCYAFLGVRPYHNLHFSVEEFSVV